MENSVVKQEYHSFKNADDYKNNLPATPMTYQISEPLADDTFTVLGNTAHAKAVSSRGFFLKFISSLSEGDVIEVECEVKNISGVKAKLAIDEAYSLNPTEIRNNVLIKQSKMLGEWEVIKAKYVVKNKLYSLAHAVAVGTFANEVSEFYVRKFRINVKKQISSDSVGYTKTITSDSVVTKWDDGSMEIESKKSFSDVGVTTPWGSIFTSSTLTLGNWANSFIDVPVVVVNGISSNNSTIMTAIASAPTATTMPSVVLTRGTVTASNMPSVVFNVFAKGKWK